MNKHFPSPQIEIRSSAIHGVLRSMILSLSRPNCQLVALHVHQEDRYECIGLFRKLFERLGEFEYRIINGDLEFEERFNDPHPDALILPYGDTLPSWAQRDIVERYRHRPAFAPPVLIVLTEKDPGELCEDGAWTLEFRARLQRSFRFPEVTVRPEADLVKAVIAFGEKLDSSVKIRKGAAELYVKKRLEYENGDPERDIPPFLHMCAIKRGAEKLIALAHRNAVLEVTSTLWLDEVSPGWRDALPQYSQSHRKKVPVVEVTGS